MRNNEIKKLSFSLKDQIIDYKLIINLEEYNQE